MINIHKAFIFFVSVWQLFFITLAAYETAWGDDDDEGNAVVFLDGSRSKPATTLSGFAWGTVNDVLNLGITVGACMFMSSVLRYHQTQLRCAISIAFLASHSTASMFNFSSALEYLHMSSELTAKEPKEILAHFKEMLIRLQSVRAFLPHELQTSKRPTPAVQDDDNDNDTENGEEESPRNITIPRPSAPSDEWSNMLVCIQDLPDVNQNHHPDDLDDGDDMIHHRQNESSAVFSQTSSSSEMSLTSSRNAYERSSNQQQQKVPNNRRQRRRRIIQRSTVVSRTSVCNYVVGVLRLVLPDDDTADFARHHFVVATALRLGHDACQRYYGTIHSYCNGVLTFAFGPDIPPLMAVRALHWVRQELLEYHDIVCFGGVECGECRRGDVGDRSQFVFSYFDGPAVRRARELADAASVFGGNIFVSSNVYNDVREVCCGRFIAAFENGFLSPPLMRLSCDDDETNNKGVYEIVECSSIINNNKNNNNNKSLREYINLFEAATHIAMIVEKDAIRATRLLLVLTQKYPHDDVARELVRRLKEMTRPELCSNELIEYLSFAEKRETGKTT
eukprot:PhM_4_TR3426/c0_g1_i2/m.487